MDWLHLNSNPQFRRDIVADENARTFPNIRCDLGFVEEMRLNFGIVRETPGMEITFAA
ncbi:hypothetical protein [Thioclava indica]|uniref:Uncharacterized protein n=1 Tax=Thioclava indica TaxID=1353528 RepID=A0A074JHZ7_9RHOB|nr:hypothetical protein [Thioclava indica]KEO55213.1 hypothetical protein DT23_17875 [Thioclava indica]